MTPQLIDDLEAVRECCLQGWGHTGTALAVNADGKQRTPWDEDVCGVCLMGAIRRMLGYDDGADAVTISLLFASDSWDLGVYSETHTKADVIRLIDRAIRKAGG